MNRKEALEKFFLNIELQYEAKLGYENELNRLQSRTSRLRDEIADLEANLHRLEKVYEEKKGVFDRLISLNDRGVTNEDLVHWDEIMRETEIDLVTIRRDIAQLGGLRQWFNNKFQEKRKTESEIQSLNREIDTLRSQKENYEAELTSLTTGSLAEAKRELERLPGIIDDLRTDLLDPKTVLKAKSIQMIDDTHDKIEKQLNKKEESWTNFFNTAEENVKEIKTAVGDILRTTYEAGKEVGQFKALEPIHRLEAGEDVPFKTGLLAIYNMNVQFRDWFRNHNLHDCLRENNRLITSIDKELRNPG